MRSAWTDVLIVTQRDDPTTDYLLPYLKKAGLSWARWDSGDLPLEATAGISIDDDGTQRVSIARTDKPNLNISDVGVVWYRRPTTQYAPAGVPTRDVRKFIDDECSHFVANLWRSVGIPMVNDPMYGHLASQKAVQLIVARDMGFTIPRTYIGNDPEAIRNLWQECDGNIVVKAFRAASVNSGERGYQSLFTTAVSKEDLIDDKTLTACPSIWQENVPKNVEVRVIVVGRHVFAAEIHSQKNGKRNDDWRSLPPDTVPHHKHELPEKIGNLCIDLVERFKTSFGAIDLILTPEGKHVFLENNPFGQWAWLQDRVDLPICEALCDHFRELSQRHYST